MITPRVQVDKQIFENLSVHSSSRTTRRPLALLNGSTFFNKDELKVMAEQNFEYVHKDLRYPQYTPNIFKDMQILMCQKEHLHATYESQSRFMENVRLALRGQCSHKDMLNHAKYFTIITLKQILGQLYINIQKSA